MTVLTVTAHCPNKDSMTTFTVHLIVNMQYMEGLFLENKIINNLMYNKYAVFAWICVELIVIFIFYMYKINTACHNRGLV